MERDRDPDLPDPNDDEDQVPEPIEPESYGEIVELSPGEDVDGDLNGAPELAGLNETKNWTGVDTLDAMRGPDAEDANRADDAPLVERVADLEERRRELVERLEALRAELPDREIAAEAHPPTATEDDGVLDAAELAADLAHKIARIDDALARLAAEGDAPFGET